MGYETDMESCTGNPLTVSYKFAIGYVFIQISNLNSSLSLYYQNLVLSQMHIAEDLLQDLKITCTIQQYFDVVLLQTNFRNHFHD